MVKLFLIFVVLFSLLLFVDGEEAIGVAEEEPAAVEQPGIMLSDGTELSEINLRSVWAEACILMWKSLVHVKQLDLPDDQGYCCQTPYRTLYSEHQSVLALGGAKNSASPKFLRFLSERHNRGFYIYSLRKLII